MKVLFDHPIPFLLSHGGCRGQIQQTKAALEKLGVEVDYLRWWEDSQPADVIHYFGRPSVLYVQHAQGKHYKVVMADLLGALGARTKPARMMQKTVKLAAQSLVSETLTVRLHWECFRIVDACVALTTWEAQLMREMFDAPAARVHCVPNGVESVFLDSQPAARGRWLVCTATITSIKRTLELAEAAAAARTPVWIIGRPFAESDPYAVRFTQVVRKHPEFVRYEGAVSDRGKLAKIYREARGFVLLSALESLSLSALEAAACECPLLLSNLPWARCTFGTKATYCPVGTKAGTAAALRRFYDEAPSLPLPPRPLSWLEVGERLRKLYRSLGKGG